MLKSILYRNVSVIIRNQEVIIFYVFFGFPKKMRCSCITRDVYDRHREVDNN